MSNAEAIDKLIEGVKVIPVVMLDSVEDALLVAECLWEGGLKAIEITLRTQAGLDCIKAVRAAFPDMVCGAGTILNANDYDNAVEKGAQFIVSPGVTPSIIEAWKASNVPLLPGAVTASEVMQLLDHGISRQKFFPAEASGGAPALKGFSSPLANVRFCPTGGVGLKNANDYLSLPNVMCIGGSWMVSKELVKAKDKAGLIDLAKNAAAL